jgi:hypothetical protein
MRVLSDAFCDANKVPAPCAVHGLHELFSLVQLRVACAVAVVPAVTCKVQG